MRWSSSASRRVPVSNDDVWAMVSDLSRYSDWLPCHQQWLDPLPRPLRRGASATEQVAVFGAIHEIRWTITEWTSPSMLQLSAAAPGLLTFSYGAQVQPIDTTSSSVTLRAVLSGPALRQLTTSQLRSATDAALERAATKLEALFHTGDLDQRPKEHPKLDWNRTMPRADESTRTCRSPTCNPVARRYCAHLGRNEIRCTPAIPVPAPVDLFDNV